MKIITRMKENVALGGQAMCHSQMSKGRVDRVAAVEPVLTSASLCVDSFPFSESLSTLHRALLFLYPPPLNGSAEKGNSSVDYPEK